MAHSRFPRLMSLNTRSVAYFYAVNCPLSLVDLSLMAPCSRQRTIVPWSITYNFHILLRCDHEPRPKAICVAATCSAIQIPQITDSTVHQIEHFSVSRSFIEITFSAIIGIFECIEPPQLSQQQEARPPSSTVTAPFQSHSLRRTAINQNIEISC